MIEPATGKKRKLFLLISIVVNVGVLGFYKYFNFISENFNLLLVSSRTGPIPMLDFILPIGLSFHTFQAMSYTIEVYRGHQKAERHFGIYALYVMFYPQMVAGPIERPQHILPQLHRLNKVNDSKFISGILLMATGLFKKMVIADRLGLYVDPVFSHPHSHSALELLLATYFFAFQIYCDFSGYTDIAIGAALVLGVELMKNFNMPYLATNLAEFWKRWHISLSTWFRDYLYIPLGGNRGPFYYTCFNLLVVFLISGLWHGANWKYLVWGLLHGFLLIGYQVLKKLRIEVKGYRFLKWLLTFNLVCLAWIFFRADSVGDAWFILKKISSAGGLTYTAGHIMDLREIGFCIILMLGLVAGEWCLRKSGGYPNSKKIIITLLLLITCYFLGIFNETQFIYFQF
ncbi:MBOAT family O-acyltransferase [Mucilaginibacter flavidus]|uniref:MBOAT family O-acyltransferase n=1 Tax=Mucilaginibacter flavidus TaxID=2949309 RepID=UPI0020927B37|nr:MBOAT family O-acyltransferase [Mucilaginibacter flavidus]MCO5947671.1 MBOAT family protein [Mucilaginibacter flavidus]